MKIEKAVEDDPEYDPGEAGAAIARFVTLHDYNLSQKAEVIVEHFRRHVAKKIGGSAKAMVVTSSRKHAVRMTRALRKYADEHGYGSLGILVAFSGTVEDEGVQYTESQMNGFPESQTPREFEQDEWRFLVVADKYQTGFDQPLLYAMYVDKVLTGLAAVQTLSRLNRRAEGKDGTFVLDFRNDAEAIRAEFETVLRRDRCPADRPEPPLRHPPRARRIRRPEARGDREGRRAARCRREPQQPRSHTRGTGPGGRPFRALEEDEQDAFRDVLGRFVRIYSFLSQVVSFTDVGLERDYRFCRALASFIKREPRIRLDLGSEVELTHLQLEQTFEGSVSLGSDQGVVTTIYSGTGRAHEPEASPLSRIIENLNERFGLKLTEADRLHLDGIAQDLVEDETVQRQAAANYNGQLRGAVPPALPVRCRRQARRRRGVLLPAAGQPGPLGAGDERLPAARLRQGEGRLAGALPHRRAARPAAEGGRAPGVQVHAAHARRHRGALQAATDRQPQDRRRVPEQQGGRDLADRGGRRRLGLRPRL